MAPTAVGRLRATSMIPTAYTVGEYADSSSLSYNILTNGIQMQQRTADRYRIAP
jgi:hypothetical protein